MFAAIREKLKGYRTIIFSWILITLGTVFGVILPVLEALNVTYLNLVIPPEYVPFAPLLLIVIGEIVKKLRKATTGPVGSKGEAAPAANVKAGD